MTTLEVLMPTYRHAAFVEQAIDSVLSQRLRDVGVTLLISDDGSDDGTQDILKRYASRYPDRIRLRLRDPATKDDMGDELPGRNTLIAHYRWASAEFIGLLEGDDHYIDNDKLQVQVDHLRAHPDLSFCATNAYNEYPGPRREDYVRGWLGTWPAGTLTQRDIVARNFIPTAGVVYRRDRFPEIPNAFHTVAALDWILYIALTEHGGFQMLDRMSAVRRVHAGGVISMKDPLVKIDRNLHLLGEIDRMTHEHHRDLTDARRAELCRDAIRTAVDRGSPEQGEKYLRLLTRTGSLRRITGRRERLRATLLVRYPLAARLLYRVLSMG